MMTIGRLAEKFGLSRSTLLYYNRIGLLSPSSRTESNYRKYGDREIKRLEQICRLRKAGLSLMDIGRILDSSHEAISFSVILEKRLEMLNQEIQQLRSQQEVIIHLLKNKNLLKKSRVMDKQSWVELLRASGLDDTAMDRWHQEFERLSPEAHQDFLESLGIPEEEIRIIRSQSRLPLSGDGEIS